jgi:putative endonuclease
MKTTYQTGLDGEKQAAEWLKKRFSMKLLESRYRNKAGEIDLIMLDRDTVVFIEVKTRLSGEPGTGLMAVDRKKQHRIARAAIIYLMKQEWLDRLVRFDVVEVSFNGIIHVPNAFQPGDMFYR